MISLKDNQPKPQESWNLSAEENAESLKLLKAVSGVSLNTLRSDDWQKKYGEFIFFPYDAAEDDLDRDDNFIYKLVGNTDAEQRFQTGNVMGFIGLGDDLQMQITSRFDQSNQNYFLHYMLQRVCNVAFAPQTGSAEDKLLDFLYYLFPSYLKAACAQGIFRAYVTRDYNDANVRGPIDVARHIRYNMPFNGKVAYHTREYTTDNKITQLVRHTIEYIRSLSFGGSILESDSDTRDYVNSIVVATPTYSKNSRMQVIARNLHPVTHPYYTAYENLRKLCLAILRHEKLSYGKSDKPIRGILFDGASLWEEYLAKVFEEKQNDFPFLTDLLHSNNRTGDNAVHLFENSKTKYYPDFYCCGELGLQKECARKGFVLDAKYKRLCTVENEETDVSQDEESESGSPETVKGVTFHYKREDLFQMLTYMHCLKAQKSILISPYRDVMGGKGGVQTPKSPKKALGYGGEISIVAVPIPACATQWDDFVAKMQNVEKELVEKIKAQIET